VQNNNIDTSGTATWNANAGFVPIGSLMFYTGTFNGAGFTISGLSIDLPNGQDVALFGATGTTALLENVGLVNNSDTGIGPVGGLVGENDGGTVETSYATGAVTGESGGNQVGGLVGFNEGGTVETSYATGAVTSGTSGYELGGLVGINNGMIEATYATGAVMGGTSGDEVGGLVGFNGGGTVETSYATGAVSGYEGVGGLVGDNDGELSVSYSTGQVTGTNDVGGFVGYTSSGTLADCYYATGASGQGSGVGTNSNAQGAYTTITYVGNSAASVTGLTLAQMMQSGNFDSNWDFTNTWTTNNGATIPLLDALSVDLSGASVGTTDTIDLIGQGNVLYTTTAVGGNYSFYVPDNVVTSGVLVGDASGYAASAYYVAGAIPSAPITGVNLYHDTLSVLGSGVASNTALGNAVNGYTGAGVDYTVTGSSLLTDMGVSMTIGSNYVLDGNVTVSGTLSTTAAGALTGSANVTLATESIALAGSVADTGVVTFNSSGTITDSGPVQVGGFILSGGTWTQIVGQNGLTALPAFSTTTDFELQGTGSTFERFAGVDSANGNAYEIADVYGLEGLASPSNSLLSANAELVNNIDASGTSSWNGGAGFVPMGNNSTNFTGIFNGQGHAINHLTINLPGSGYVGLFGYSASGSVVENVGLVDDSVSGAALVGGLVGLNDGTVKRATPPAR
jgi:hypothetical protein